MATLITMQQFHTYTQCAFSVSPAKLELASEQVIGYCDNSFGVQTITHEKRRSKLTADQDLHVDFLIKPVVSVSAISLVFGEPETETELALTNMDLFNREGYALIPMADVTACRARVMRASLGVGFLTLGDEYVTWSTYVGGVAAPILVREAVALLALEDHLVKERWATGDLSGGVVKSFSVGAYSQTIGSPYTAGYKLTGLLGHGTPISQSAEIKLIDAGYTKGGVVGVAGS